MAIESVYAESNVMMSAPSAGGISSSAGGFLEALTLQMTELVTAYQDGDLTYGEISQISSGVSGEEFDEFEKTDTTDVAYSDAAAGLYLSIKVADITTIENAIIEMISKYGDIMDQASKLMSS